MCRIKLTSHAGKSRNQSRAASRASAAFVTGPAGAVAAQAGLGAAADFAATGGVVGRRSGGATGLVGAAVIGAAVFGVAVSRAASSFRAARSCSSVSSMLVPHIQQSAINSHRRIDIGAWHSGHAQESTSPLSHKPALESPSFPAVKFAGASASSADDEPQSPGAAAPAATGSTISKLESCSAVLMTEEMSGLGTVRQSSCSLTLAIAQWQQSPALEALNWRGFESC
jgi:hypothetical protein